MLSRKQRKDNIILNSKEFIEKITKTDFYQNIVQEKNAKLVTKRQETVEEIESNEKAHLRKSKEIAAKLKKNKKELRVAREKYNQLKKVQGDLLRENNNASSDHQRKRAEQENFLRQTADQKIFDATYKCKHRQYDLREIKIVCISGGRKFNHFTGMYDKHWLTNRDDIDSALEYSRGCVKKLEAMKMKPAVDSKEVDRLLAEHKKKTTRVTIR